MTRVVVVAETGAALAALTAAVGAVRGAYIVRHANSRAPLERLICSVGPDLVVIGDLCVPKDALARLAEIRAAAPHAKVVVISSSTDVRWLAAAQATAVVPADLEPRTLGVVLREVLAESDAVPTPLPVRRRRGEPVVHSEQGAAA